MDIIFPPRGFSFLIRKIFFKAINNPALIIRLLIMATFTLRRHARCCALYLVMAAYLSKSTKKPHPTVRLIDYADTSEMRQNPASHFTPYSE